LGLLNKPIGKSSSKQGTKSYTEIGINSYAKTYSHPERRSEENGRCRGSGAPRSHALRGNVSGAIRAPLDERDLPWIVNANQLKLIRYRFANIGKGFKS
jgi:hypothetical protein